MSLSRILVFSSSRVGQGGYLENAFPIIKKFLEDRPLNIAFIPFASVDSYEDYLGSVSKALASLPYTMQMVTPETAIATINQADAIMVGGGNTFKLLADIYNAKMLDVTRDKINAGTPYIGWSAGSNIVGSTIGTTNDMPIIQPKSFNALGLLPFQINPHYFNQPIVGHNGETRDQRLTEFLVINPSVPIVCLPEGTALHLEKGKLTLIGDRPAVLLSRKKNSTEIIKREILVDEDVSFLL